MKRVAVVGANGQVAAELCLIFRHHPEIEVVPICRNVGGSAFLRWSGIACRHGQVADAAQARGLLGDCDAVINAAIAAGTPRQMVDTERKLIRHCLEYARGGPLIYFSTQMVHGDPRPTARLHWRSSYGKAKLRCEQLVRSNAARFGRTAFILRLGHVCGELQNITALARQRIRSGPIVLSATERVSNTVYTATIVDAILKILAGRVPAGTYDLMNQPEWTWAQVHEYEAQRAAAPLQVVRVAERSGDGGPAGWGKGLARRWMRRLGGTEWGKELGLRVMAHLPVSYNERTQAAWFRARAAAEISGLSQYRIDDESFTWRPLGRAFIAALANTADLLRDPKYLVDTTNRPAEWAGELPLFKD